MSLSPLPSTTTGYVAKTYNRIFSLASMIVLIGIFVKVFFFGNVRINNEDSQQHLDNALFTTPSTFSSTMLAEHKANKRYLQEHRAMRLLMKQYQSDPIAFEKSFKSLFHSTFEESNFISTIPKSASCHPHNFSDTWNKTAFEFFPWEFMHTQKNIDTFMKHIPGSKLMAFRGVSLMENVHISHALGPFVNVSHSLDWVPVLKHIEALSIINADTKLPFPHMQSPSLNQTDGSFHLWYHSDAIYQILRLPWPITPRDLYLLRHFTFDANKRQVTVRYHSLIETDPQRLDKWTKLHSNHVIRALTPHTMWRFTVIPASVVKTDSDNSSNINNSTNGKIKENESKVQLFEEYDNICSKNSSNKLNKRFTKSNLFALWKKRFSRIYHKVIVSPLKQTLKPLWQKLKRLVPIQFRPAKSFVGVNDNIDSITKEIAKEPVYEMKSVTDTGKSAAASAAAAVTVPTANSCLPLPSHHSDNKNAKKGSSAHVLVEVETVIDSQGSIPTWFVNFMQRQWPVTTLDTFRHLALKGDITPHPAVECW